MNAASLAHELHETNRLLRDLVEPPDDRVGYRSDLMPVAGFAFIATFRALRNALVAVPESYWTIEDGRATIACRCREALDVPLYSFHECGCGRIFCVTHRGVKVIPLDA